MMKMKLPSGRVLNVETFHSRSECKKEENQKARSEKPDVTINIYGGNNSIAPNAETAEQNIQTEGK